MQFVDEHLLVYICVNLKCSQSEKGKAEFKCERIEDKAEELKESDTVETIGPTEGGRIEMEMNLFQIELY